MAWPTWMIYAPKVTDFRGNPYNSSNPPAPTSDQLQSISNDIKTNLGVAPNAQVLRQLFDYYFAQFEPYITNTDYQKQITSLDGSSPSSQAGLYNKRFVKNLTAWGKTVNLNLLTQSQNTVAAVNSFATFLEEDDSTADIRQKYFSIIFYCIDKLLTAMQETQKSQILFSKNMTKYYYGMLAAQTGISRVKITELTGSDINPQLADPKALAQQQMDLLEIEKHRQAFNLSRDSSRQTEADLQFAQEANSQFVSTLDSLFNRQELALKSIIKS